jgi:hypothetical protein
MSRKPNAATVVLAGWLLPGGGHFLLGRRTQAWFFFISITVAYVFGMFLADFSNVSPERHGYYFLAHILNGGTTMVATLLTSGVELEAVPRHFGFETEEIGTLYTAVASLLNVIVVMNAFGLVLGIESDPRRKKKRKSKLEEEPATP